MKINNQQSKLPLEKILKRRNIIWLLAGLIGISLVVGLFFLKKKQQTLDATGETDVVLRLGLAVQPSNALVFVALRKGLFAKNGLRLEVQEYPSGKRAMNEAFLTGRADIITCSDTPIVFAGLDHSNFRIIASTFTASNLNRVIARKDAGISEPLDLAGKRVATQKASAVHFFLHLFLIENSLSENNVKLSFMRAESLPSSLRDSEIDAFSMREPYISQAKEMLGENAVIFAAPGIYEQVEVLLVSQKLVDKNSLAIKKLLRAMLQAEEFTRKHPKETMAIVADRLGVATKALSGIWPQIQFRIALEQSLLLLLEDQARWAIRAGLTTKTAVPNYLELIFFDALKQMKPEAVSIIQ